MTTEKTKNRHDLTRVTVSTSLEFRTTNHLDSKTLRQLHDNNDNNGFSKFFQKLITQEIDRIPVKFHVNLMSIHEHKFQDEVHLHLKGAAPLVLENGFGSVAINIVMKLAPFNSKSNL